MNDHNKSGVRKNGIGVFFLIGRNAQSCNGGHRGAKVGPTAGANAKCLILTLAMSPAGAKWSLYPQNRGVTVCISARSMPKTAFGQVGESD